jgi:undecaprenyl-diphosphatase
MGLDRSRQPTMKDDQPKRFVAKAKGAGRWLRENTDLFVLLVLAIVCVTTWLVAELVDEVLEGSTQRYDVWMLQHLRAPGNPHEPIGPKWFVDLWRDITALGSTAILTLVTAAAAGYLVLQRQYRTLILLLSATLGGLLITLLLKDLFARPRPEFAAEGAYVLTASFPSGHSALSAVVYLTLGTLLARTSRQYRFKLYFIGMAVLVTLLVGFSRVYLGVHYPTDVLAGWCIGLIWALLCWLIARFLQKRGAIEPPQDALGT